MNVWQVIQQEIDEVLTLSINKQMSELKSIADYYVQLGKPFYTTALLCMADEMPQLIP